MNRKADNHLKEKSRNFKSRGKVRIRIENREEKKGKKNNSGRIAKKTNLISPPALKTKRERVRKSDEHWYQKHLGTHSKTRHPQKERYPKLEKDGAEIDEIPKSVREQIVKKCNKRTCWQRNGE